MENELKETAEAFDDHYDQTEVQSILAWLNNFIGCLTNQSEMIDTPSPTKVKMVNHIRGGELQVYSVLYGHGKYVFKREFCIYRGFMKVFYTLPLAWKKNHKMCIWNNWFLAMCSAILTYVNGSRIQLVLYANCFLQLTYGFLNKNFQQIKLFICPCSLKHDRETTDQKIFRNTTDGLLPILELKLKCCFCTCSIELLFIVLFITFHLRVLQCAALFP